MELQKHTLLTAELALKFGFIAGRFFLQRRKEPLRKEETDHVVA
jgi:hypothetical protein